MKENAPNPIPSPGDKDDRQTRRTFLATIGASAVHAIFGNESAQAQLGQSRSGIKPDLHIDTTLPARKGIIENMPVDDMDFRSRYLQSCQDLTSKILGLNSYKAELKKLLGTRDSRAFPLDPDFVQEFKVTLPAGGYDLKGIEVAMTGQPNPRYAEIVINLRFDITDQDRKAGRSLRVLRIKFLDDNKGTDFAWNRTY